MILVLVLALVFVGGAGALWWTLRRDKPEDLGQLSDGWMRTRGWVAKR